jgi:glycosyltransferase involved in cell wall biosynthesis
MKILFLNSDAELYGNGADKILLLTINALSESHEIDVLLPYNGPLVDAIQQSGIKCHVKPYAVLRRNSVAPLRLMKYVINLVWSSYVLYRYIKKNNIDTLYSNTSCILQGLILRKFGAIKQVWHIHEIVDEPWYAKKFLSIFISRGADLCICVSTAVKNNIDKNANHLLVLWNGIPPVSQDHVTFKRYGIPNIVVLGRFNRLKGQQHLVRSIKVLKEGALKNLQFSVRLVGGIYGDDDSYLNDTRNLIKFLQLNEIITIEKCVQDVSGICCNATVLVVPSERPDPFPTVALEAMSVGTPVVGYWQGGLPEMLDYDIQCLAKYRDHIDLANKLVPFLVNEKFRITKASQQKCAHYKLYIELMADFIRIV